MTDQLFEPEEPRPSLAAAADAPLPARMRPQTLDEVVGQDHVLGEGSTLRSAIEHGRPFSMVLYGPPGTGKTTLARIVAVAADAAFEELSAVQAGKAEVRAVIDRAAERRRGGRSTIFFLDEIHRFNKAQQDALLPAVEEGLRHADRSDDREPLLRGQLRAAVARAGHRAAAARRQRRCRRCCAARSSAARWRQRSTTTRSRSWRQRSGGDARTALAALELAADTAGERVTLAGAEDALQRRAIRYDKAGDHHYDTISAWIKSTRGSDPDASLYYLAVMLEGGEDARFIARRMVILASEDVGNADPQALVVAVAAADAVEHVGMPEAVHALAQAAIYLSLAPKSNAAYRAIGAARAHVREHGAQVPPAAVRSAAYAGAAALGRGQGYDYPHDHPGHLSPMELLPDALRGTRFYEPDDAEAALAARLQEIREARGRPQP